MLIPAFVITGTVPLLTPNTILKRSWLEEAGSAVTLKSTVVTLPSTFIGVLVFNQVSCKKADGSVTTVGFSVTADPASSNPDRFRIVFMVNKADIPVVVAGVKGIVIYPNPVTSRMVNIKFTDMEKGIYQLRLISTGGQLIMAQQVNHGGGSNTLKMGLDNQIANGNYQLEIINPDKSRSVRSLIIVN